MPPAFQARHEDQNLTTYRWGDGERFALLARAMASLLFEVKPHDPLVFLATGALLAAVALVASFIPSLQAVWIHPSEAPRHD